MLTILNVAYPYAEVTRDSLGGAEQVLFGIDRALCESGYTSLVVASAGSAVTGELVAVKVPRQVITPALRAAVAASYRRTIERVLSERQVDLVHFHGVDCAEYLPRTSLPRLVTLHLPPSEYDPGLFRTPGLTIGCVSQSQREACPPEVRVASVIENGIDLARWAPMQSEVGDYALCLGRICPEKGFELALKAARRAGVPLRLAGIVYPYPDHERYFRDEIVPLLDDERRFVGPVVGDEKHRLLARARCLVVPSRVSETSSLVTMEALACGTPVIVSNRGAPRTMIESGITGVIADTEDELVAALDVVKGLDRPRCRESAEQRFDQRRSTDQYLELYRELSPSGPASQRRSGIATIASTGASPAAVAR